MLKNTKEETYPKISLVVPCYNEAAVVGSLLNSVLIEAGKLGVDFEILIVDDGSTDGTSASLESFMNIPEVSIIRHTRNLGKGASVKSAMKKAKGDIIVIQDADNEYDPKDLSALIEPIILERADVVYGSRFLGGKPRRAFYFSHAIANKILTAITNILTGLNITDMETGYKAIKRTMLDKIELKEKRFGIEPELTIKLSRIKNIRFFEVGISYYGRSLGEGKKIKWTDGVWALYCLFKYRLS
jgi:glycosyltransferase involved in cell wall biosynthesis